MRHYHKRVRLLVFIALSVAVLLGTFVLGTFVLSTSILVGRGVPISKVYTVTAVQVGLRQNPGAWIGHTVTVRGVVIWYSYDHWGPNLLHAGGQDACFTWLHTCLLRQELTAIASNSTVHLALAAQPLNFGIGQDPVQVLKTHPTLALPLVFREPSLPHDPIPSLLRRLPLIGSLLPMPEQWRPPVSGLYTIHILPRVSHSCRRNRCSTATFILVHAQP